MSAHVRLAHGSTFVCDHCRARYAMAMPAPFEVFAAAAKAFDTAHASCPPGAPFPRPKTAWEWATSDDTGNSSLTIFDVLGHPPGRDFTPSVPWDPDDFGRCYRLLEVVPEWRERLGKVAQTWPAWAPLVEHWAEMEALYREESPRGRCPKLYALMQKLTGRGDR